MSLDGTRAAVGLRNEGRDGLTIRVVDTRDGTPLGNYLPDFTTSRACLNHDLNGYYIIQRLRGTNILSFCGLDGTIERTISQSLPIADIAQVSLRAFAQTDYLLITIAHTNQSRDYYLLDLDTGLPRRFWTECSNSASFRRIEQNLIILTDRDAPKGQVLSMSVEEPDITVAVTAIPECDYPIKTIATTRNDIVVVYVISPWSNAIKVFSPTGQLLRQPSVPGQGTIGNIKTRDLGDELAYEFSSIGQRPRIYRYARGTNSCIYYPPSPLPMPDIHVETLWFPAMDGTTIPISISRRQDVTLSPEVPTLLTAYGGFGVSETLRFTNRSALWLMMGGSYVHVGIRGGGELGRKWHEQGALHNKQRSIEDFVAAAEWLISTGRTSPKRLAIIGGSNAGLLVGAALTQRPDLFAAVVCTGPLLDMLRYHLFPGKEYVFEYGSPEDSVDREVLERYSPYHRVQDGVKYPPVLLVSGGADTRCDPMHARKMTARLQAAEAQNRILLDYRPQRGHAGPLPMDMRIDSITNQFCFILSALQLRVTSSQMMVPDAT